MAEGKVLCCICGVLIQPNAANMCANCLRSEVDITEGLQKDVRIFHCPECDSYLQPPRTWIKAQLESNELKTFCLRKLKNLNTVRLVNAGFIWTEPHSKRIKMRLTVQKEVMHGAILEQAYTVEYVVVDQLCEACSRVQANPDQWVASVQLTQHVSHKRTFFHLEQLIVKHNAACRAIRIKQMDHGIDFFFSNRSHAMRFAEFVGKVAPVRSRNDDKQLVSHDTKSNNYKYTFCVEISPVCREDLICLPPKVSVSLGNLGPLMICTKVSNCIALLDPFTLRHCFLDADKYWRAAFQPLLTSRQLVKYIVLDVEIFSSEVNVGGSKYVMADVQVARESDFGKNDIMFNVRTHIGRLLKPGDYAFGYDLYSANTNDLEVDKYRGFDLPEVVLVKKSCERTLQKKRREEKIASEYEQFLRDLEENPDLRFNVSLYEDRDHQPSEMASMTDGDDLPKIPLEELADLRLSDGEDEEDDDDEMAE